MDNQVNHPLSFEHVVKCDQLDFLSADTALYSPVKNPLKPGTCYGLSVGFGAQISLLCQQHDVKSVDEFKTVLAPVVSRALGAFASACVMSQGAFCALEAVSSTEITPMNAVEKATVSWCNYMLLPFVMNGLQCVSLTDVKLSGKDEQYLHGALSKVLESTYTTIIPKTDPIVLVFGFYPESMKGLGHALTIVLPKGFDSIFERPTIAFDSNSGVYVREAVKPNGNITPGEWLVQAILQMIEMSMAVLGWKRPLTKVRLGTYFAGQHEDYMSLMAKVSEAVKAKSLPLAITEM